MEFVNQEVNHNGEFALFIEGEIYHGTLEDLKYEIARYVEEGGSAEDCFISEFNVLEGVQITKSREVHIPLDDVNEEYDVLEEEFVVYLRGEYYEAFSQVQYAVECMEQLLAKYPDLDLEEDVSLLRKPIFACDFQVNATTKIEITIPAQRIPTPVQTGGMDWERKPSDYLKQELTKIQDILFKRA